MAKSGLRLIIMRSVYDKEKVFLVLNAPEYVLKTPKKNIFNNIDFDLQNLFLYYVLIIVSGYQINIKIL